MRSSIALTALLLGCGSGTIEDAHAPADQARPQPIPVIDSAVDSGTTSADSAAPSEDTAAHSDTNPPDKLPGATNPMGTPSKRFLVVTAGQSNAGFRIDDGGISYGGAWNWPLSTQQSTLIQKSLGALEAGDLGDRGTESELTAVGGCPLMKSTDGGCHFVDDLASADPSKWVLSDIGVKLARRINNAKFKKDVVFISWIQGEADAKALAEDNMRGARKNGGPYDFTSAEQWADHYRDVLTALLRLTRAETELPKLRMVVQLIANYGGRADLIRHAQLDAARASKGDIVVGNANPWQHYRPNGDDWSHYSGQAYMDFALETGRVVAFALRRSGLADTLDGPTYGDFPEIVETKVSGATVDLVVSNPNGASTLVVPKDPAGFSAYGGDKPLTITSVALAAPFTLRLTLSAAPSAKITVTYGTEGNRPKAGGAITDDAATACAKEPDGVVRHNMPLMVKPL